MLLLLLKGKGHLNDNEIEWITNVGTVIRSFDRNKFSELTSQELTQITTDAPLKTVEEHEQDIEDAPIEEP